MAAPDDPQEREIFIETYISTRSWRVSEFVFAEGAIFPGDTVPTLDLIASLPACRLDDQYIWDFSSQNVEIHFVDGDNRCSSMEPDYIESGIFYDLNDSLTVGTADFKEIDAINKFLDVEEPRIGNTSRSRYIMEWSLSSLRNDRIVIDGIFTDSTLGVPPFKLVFTPI